MIKNQMFKKSNNLLASLKIRVRRYSRLRKSKKLIQGIFKIRFRLLRTR